MDWIKQMTTLKTGNFIILFIFMVLAHLAQRADADPTTNSVVQKQEIQNLLKENEDLRRKIKPADKDIISQLKKDNKKLREEIKKKKRKWEREISAGANLAKGNSDSMTINIGIKGNYKAGKNKMTLKANGNYGESKGTTNLERLKGEGKYDYSFNSKSYGLIFGSVEHDDMANLDYRLIASPGIGYKILSTGKPKLDVELGPAYVGESFRDQSFSSMIGCRVAQTFKYKINNAFKVTESLSFIGNIADVQDYFFNAEVGIESDLTEKLLLRVTLKDNFVNQPATDKKNNDIYLISSLVLKF